MSCLALVITIPFALVSIGIFAVVGMLDLFVVTFALLGNFAIVYSAMWLLTCRDKRRHDVALRKIRAELKSKPEQTDEEFIGHGSSHEGILIGIRNVVAEILEVPAGKIGRDAPVIRTIRENDLEFEFFISFFSKFLSDRVAANTPIRLPPDSVETIDQFTDWVYETYLMQCDRA